MLLALVIMSLSERSEEKGPGGLMVWLLSDSSHIGVLVYVCVDDSFVHRGRRVCAYVCACACVRRKGGRLGGGLKEEEAPFTKDRWREALCVYACLFVLCIS